MSHGSLQSSWISSARFAWACSDSCSCSRGWLAGPLRGRLMLCACLKGHLSYPPRGLPSTSRQDELLPGLVAPHARRAGKPAVPHKTWPQRPTGPRRHVLLVGATPDSGAWRSRVHVDPDRRVPGALLLPWSTPRTYCAMACTAGALGLPLLLLPQPHVTLIPAELSPRIWWQQESQWELTLSRT